MKTADKCTCNVLLKIFMKNARVEAYKFGEARYIQNNILKDKSRFEVVETYEN